MTKITTLTQVNPEHLSDKKQELILQQNKLDGLFYYWRPSEYC